MSTYEQCQKAGHDRTRHSPDGLTVIEDCDSCRLRWIMPNRFSILLTQPTTIHNSSVFDNQPTK